MIAQINFHDEWSQRQSSRSKSGTSDKGTSSSRLTLDPIPIDPEPKPMFPESDSKQSENKKEVKIAAGELPEQEAAAPTVNPEEERRIGLKELQFLFRQDEMYYRTMNDLEPSLFDVLQASLLSNHTDNRRIEEEDSMDTFTDSDTDNVHKGRGRFLSKKVQTDHSAIGLEMMLSPRVQKRVRAILDHEMKMLNLGLGIFPEKYKMMSIKPLKKLGRKNRIGR